MNVTDINNSPKKEVDKLKTQVKGLLAELKERDEEAAVMRDSYMVMAGELKEVRVINEQLRAKYGVLENQHNNALAMLEDCGLIKQ